MNASKAYSLYKNLEVLAGMFFGTLYPCMQKLCNDFPTMFDLLFHTDISRSLKFIIDHSSNTQSQDTVLLLTSNDTENQKRFNSTLHIRSLVQVIMSASLLALDARSVFLF